MVQKSNLEKNSKWNSVSKGNGVVETKGTKCLVFMGLTRMKMAKWLFFFVLFFFVSYHGYGQVSQGGIPHSLQLDSEKRNENNRDERTLSKNIPVFDMPSIEQSIIEKLKEDNNKRQKSYQFAYSFDTIIDVKKTAIKDSVECGFLYRLAIKSTGAYSINIIFSEYHLPPCAKLFMYNESYEHLIGAFTSNNNKESKVLAVSPVAGEKIIIEYFEPYFVDFDGSLIIGKVSHDFLDILNSGEKSELRASDPCQVDVNCSPEGDDWQKEKRSVCRILINGSGLCSGALINNTNNDGKSYFLTANHCISTQKEAEKSVFYFNYERTVCKSGSGSLSQSISGATLRATSSDRADFTLLELSKIPLSTFRPYFAGWDRNNFHNAGGVSIHHPSGDVKKISTYAMAPEPTGYGSNVVNLNETHWRVIWIRTTTDHGVTEGGSSGSPLFNSNKKIIGQLHGGSSYCHTPSNPDWYGRFDFSWTGNNTVATRLVSWLNPNNDRVVLDGIDACETGTKLNWSLNNTISSGYHIYQATNNIESTSTIQSGATVKYEAGNSIVLKPGFKAEAGSNFSASIKNFNCVVVPDPINLVNWTSLACIDDGLHFSITNATNYTVKIYMANGGLIYSNSGSISGNFVTVWTVPSPIAVGYYTANITFSNPAQEISNAYTIFVTPCSKQKSATISDTSDTSEVNQPIQEMSSSKFDFTVYPNPNEGNFTIELLEAEDMKPYSVQIFNSLGMLISKIEHCNVYQITVNRTDLPSGIYYVKLSMGNNIAIKKVIIQ